MRNHSDESVVERWAENSYCQYLGGTISFVPSVPKEPSELLHFRKRIGTKGVELILKESVHVNGDDSNDANVSIDITVQQKNSTFFIDV